MKSRYAYVYARRADRDSQAEKKPRKKRRYHGGGRLTKQPEQPAANDCLRVIHLHHPTTIQLTYQESNRQAATYLPI
jgi:hypothetical protein